jgi:hypothetical protein
VKVGLWAAGLLGISFSKAIISAPYHWSRLQFFQWEASYLPGGSKTVCLQTYV